MMGSTFVKKPCSKFMMGGGDLRGGGGALRAAKKALRGQKGLRALQQWLARRVTPPPYTSTLKVKGKTGKRDPHAWTRPCLHTMCSTKRT